MWRGSGWTWWGGLTDGHENRHSPRPGGVFNCVAETATEALSRENGDREVAHVCWAFQAEEPLSHAWQTGAPRPTSMSPESACATPSLGLFYWTSNSSVRTFWKALKRYLLLAHKFYFLELIPGNKYADSKNTLLRWLNVQFIKRLATRSNCCVRRLVALRRTAHSTVPLSGIHGVDGLMRKVTVFSRWEEVAFYDAEIDVHFSSLMAPNPVGKHF